ncbi:SDR family NAD(P)-dependent oxidoreductase [Enterococcus massiliensis]|uniref:SDR family NAD(P)-dependent oxidoreductase n=1 Tax=Enterococcus massiliensis TaxID=1640685 RepID=UPI00065E2AC7|nr:SDR family oxidoreductase [Enterococcus massiliensis]
MKKIIITGAAGGIGQALIARCLQEGYHVIAIDKEHEKLTALSSHPHLTTTCIDVTNYQAVAHFFEGIADQPLYGLVNNAGVYNAFSLLDYDEAAIDRILEINIKGATVFSKFFIQHLIQQEAHGRIINISSISGQEGSSDALYGLSKAALLGLTKSLALRFSPQILVNAIAPTMVDTDMMAIIPDWRKKEYQQHHLIKEPVLPKDVADTANFLLSEESAHYTGATFDLNNGGYLR